MLTIYKAWIHKKWKDLTLLVFIALVFFPRMLLSTQDSVSSMAGRSQKAQTSDQQGLDAKALFSQAQLLISEDLNDSAEIQLELALPLCKAEQDYDLCSQIQIELGKLKKYRGDDVTALKLFNAALEDAERVDNYRLMGSAHSLIGSIYRVLGAYDEALESIIKAKSNYQLAEFEEGSAWVSYSLGRLYRSIKMLDEAESAFNESLDLYGKLAIMNADSTGIALCLDQLGLLQLDRGAPQQAVPFFQRSLEIYIMNNSAYGISNAWKSLGKAKYAMGHYLQAETLLRNALFYKNGAKDAMGIPGIYEFLGLVLIAQDQWQAGLDTLIVALGMAQANNQQQIQADIHGRLAQVFEERGQYPQAIEHYKAQFKHQGFIGSNSVRFQLPELRSIYEMEQGRKEIRALQQSNQIIALQLATQRTIQWASIISGLILSLFIVFLYLQYRRIRATNGENLNLIIELHEEIQQRERVEKALAQSDGIRELLLDVITHDLKNPAGVIYSLSEMARTQMPENRLIAGIFSSSGHLLKVLENTTTLSQATFGEDIPREALHLSALVTQVVNEFSSSLETAGISVETHIPRNLVIHANPLISEILKNYISNAITYASSGKQIIIEAAVEGETVSLKVKDYGITIPEDQREYIFERHTQLKDGEKSGRGLGLAIVKRIASTHGGEVWVEPNSPQGNSFCLRIPHP